MQVDTLCASRGTEQSPVLKPTLFRLNEIKRRMSDKISKTLRAETCVKEVKEGDQLPENFSTNFDVSEVELKVSSN